MGSWFSNLHIRKNERITDASVADGICKLMESRHYLPAASQENADAVVFVVSGKNSGWYSIYSDDLAHGDSASSLQIASPLSEILHTDVLTIACFDSDYLYLNLVRPEERVNAWVGIGSAAGLDIGRRSGITAWRKKVSDFETFSASAKAGYVCAEQFLWEVESCLDLPAELAAAIPKDLQDMASDVTITSLCFRCQDDTAQPESVQLRSESLELPFLMERESHVGACSVGKAAKGIKVYFLGPYVEHDEITFSDVKFNKTPIELTKVCLPDGRWAYCYHDPDFEIPPGPPSHLPKAKRLALEWRQGFGIDFTPHGNQRMALDITVAFVPDENPAGGTEYAVWHRFGSKAAFIKEHNRIWKWVWAIETDPNSCLPLLKESDFD